MPALLILVLSFALEGIWREKVGGRLPIVLEVKDAGPGAAAVASRLAASASVDVVERIVAAGEESGGPDAARAGEALERSQLEGGPAAGAPATGRAKAAVVIPEGFSRDFDALLAARGAGPFGAHRIELWTDPALDASWRGLLGATIGLAIQDAVLARLSRAPGDGGRADGAAAP